MPKIGAALFLAAGDISSAIFSPMKEPMTSPGADRLRHLGIAGAYRTRLKMAAEGRENFDSARAKRFLLGEARNFVELVGGTFHIPAALRPALKPIL
jgi:hypothetical protein